METKEIILTASYGLLLYGFLLVEMIEERIREKDKIEP
jgi:hypothetical protein